MTGKAKADRGPRVPSSPNAPDVAASLAAIGWPVFPVSIYAGTPENGMKRSKVPAVKWTDPDEGATTDVAKVRAWWTGEHKGRWIGVHTGRAGLVVLDVDPGGDASLAAADLVADPTFTYPTHRKGGEHHVYAAPEGVELTIARELVVNGTALAGIDVRSGNGLMVYYGPELKKAPRLAPAPDWLLVTRDRPAYRGGIDAAPDATVTAWLERTSPGDMDAAVTNALDAIAADGMGHDDMLAAVTELVRLGVQGAQGVAHALGEARARYADGWPDADRAWDMALQGSVRRFGLPPTTLEITDAENDALIFRASDEPAAVEQREAEATQRKRVARVAIHEKGMKAADAPKPPEAGTRILEDGPLAQEFVTMHGAVWAYSQGFGLMRWRWVGKKKRRAGRWRPAERHSLVEHVRAYLTRIEIDEHTVAAMRGAEKDIVKARTLLARSRAGHVADFVTGILAEHEPAFNAHHDLLNTPTGVVDLRTGKLHRARPDLYLTRMTPVGYDPKADMTRWRQALGALPKKSGAWMQVRMGQAMTGYTPDDDRMLILSGGGENGKTTWLTAIRTAAGDSTEGGYVATISKKVLLSSPDEHPTSLMTLQGARLAVMEELPEGRNLNVERLKDTVGTPKITARRMRQDDVTFSATHAMVVTTNYGLIVNETDHGTWRRLALVRFPYRFVKRRADMKTKRDRLGDPSVRRHFESVADPGVLRWLVEGAVKWYGGDMRMPDPPSRVAADTEAWRQDADPILAFSRDRLTRDPDYGITTQDLADEFNVWLERRGHHRWNQQTINGRMGGHVEFEGIPRRMLRYGNVLTGGPKRSRSVATLTPLVGTGGDVSAESWAGLRFKGDTDTTQAERDARVLNDLERSW